PSILKMADSSLQPLSLLVNCYLENFKHLLSRIMTEIRIHPSITTRTSGNMSSEACIEQRRLRHCRTVKKISFNCVGGSNQPEAKEFRSGHSTCHGVQLWLPPADAFLWKVSIIA